MTAPSGHAHNWVDGTTAITAAKLNEDEGDIAAVISAHNVLTGVVAAKAPKVDLAQYTATGKSNGAVATLDTGQTVYNFGAAPATVTSGVLSNTPVGGGPNAAYIQTDLGATIGHVGANVEFTGAGILAIVVPSASWTDFSGNMVAPFPTAGAHIGITPTSWSYGVWTGAGGQIVIATGSLNFSNNVPFDVDCYFDTSTSSAYLSFSDGTFATITDSRINTWRSSLIIWELFANSSADSPAKLHTLRGDVETGAHAATLNDVARARSRQVAQANASSVVTDEFMGGTTTSGAVGALGWLTTGGTVAKTTAAVGHPGTVQLATGASSGTLTALYLGDTIAASEFWDLTWWVKIESVDSSTTLRIGWSSDATAAAPAHALYFEKLTTDTNWFAAPRVANLTGPRSDMGVTAVAGWAKFRIRQSQSLNILFSINGGAETDVTQYLPGSTEFLEPMVQITNGAAANKTISIDRMQVTMSNLAR